MAKRARVKKVVTKRTHRLVLTLNDDEAQALEFFVSHHKRGTQTKVALVRELLMAQIIQQCESETEMLFKEEEMR